MSKVLKIWARKILFGPSPQRELPRDLLPGLNVPRIPPKPPIPYNPASDRQESPSLEETYGRFLQQKPKTKSSKKTNDGTNWPDSMSGM